MVRAHPVLKYLSVTPPENSGGAENATENSGPHAKNFFCSMYESSLRHPVWVPEINVKPCNSVETYLFDIKDAQPKQTLCFSSSCFCMELKQIFLTPISEGIQYKIC